MFYLALESCPSSGPLIFFIRVIFPDIIVLSGRNYGTLKSWILKSRWQIIRLPCISIFKAENSMCKAYNYSLSFPHLTLTLPHFYNFKFATFNSLLTGG